MFGCEKRFEEYERVLSAADDFFEHLINFLRFELDLPFDDLEAKAFAKWQDIVFEFFRILLARYY